MEVIVNGRPRRYREKVTVAQVVEDVTEGRSDRTGIAVALNDEIVHRHEWASTTVGEGDRIEIVTAVQGG